MCSEHTGILESWNPFGCCACVLHSVSVLHVQYYKESDEWNSSLLHRTGQLPSRCISYSPSGSMMAVVGDNFDVTHITLNAGSKVGLPLLSIPIIITFEIDMKTGT